MHDSFQQRLSAIGQMEWEKSAPVAKVGLARRLVPPQPNPERSQASMLA